jgi:hypothetical protein
MLAQIEHGRVTPIVNEPPEYAFYWCLYPEHVHRLLGRRSWTRSGPRYVLDDDGRVVYAGSYDLCRESHPLFTRIRWQIRKSAFGRRVLAFTPPVTRADKRLLLQVIERSREHLRVVYPNIEFHVLLSARGREYDEVAGSLRTRGFPVHSVDSILAESGLPREVLRLHFMDLHPSAHAHDLIARYLAEEVLLDAPRTDPSLVAE